MSQPFIDFVKSNMVSRRDVYAVQKTNGDYYPVKVQLLNSDFEKHLKGEITVGLYQLAQDNTIKWFVFDIDVKKEYVGEFQIHEAALKKQVSALKNKINSFGIETQIEFSGRRGYHLWGFFQEPMLASSIRLFLQAIVKEVGIVNKALDVEIFPKQTEIGNDGYGSLVKLPCGVHQLSGNYSRLMDDNFNEMPPESITSVSLIEKDHWEDIVHSSYNFGQNDSQTQKLLDSQAGFPKLTLPDLNRIRQHCPVINEAFESIENDQDNEKTPGHNKRLTVASMVKHTIDDEDYVLDLFSKASDFDKERTLKHFRSINKPPITCRQLHEWNLCIKPCQLMKDIGKKSPIAFAYRDGVRIQLTEDLYKDLDDDSCFEEVLWRISEISNPVRQMKSISRLQSETGLGKREIQKALKQTNIVDDEKSYIVNGKVVPVKAAKYIVENYRIMRYQQDFCMYNDGIWKKLLGEEMESIIHHEIGGFSCNYNVNEIKNAIIRESLVTEEEIDRLQDKNIIAVANGLLDVRSKELKDLQPEYYAFKKMWAAYDPDAVCPMFRRFIDELFKGDTDAADKTKLVQEMFGYLLIPDYTLVKKMFYFYGRKADNGKSSLIEIIRSVFGPGYFDSVPMDKLDGFLLKRLKGMHANVVGDQNAHTRVPDGIIKLLIGGLDDITADVKNKDAINFINTARLIFAVNRLPYSEAKDEGYFTRTAILVFNNQFIVNPDPKNPRQMKADSEKIHNIKEHEKDGILNWMLEGLERLLTNRKLTVPASSEMALEEYKNTNSTVLLFVREECELGHSYFINRAELYDNYRDWCNKYGFRRYVNAHTFFDTLIREFNVSERRSTKERFLDGIRPL